MYHHLAHLYDWPGSLEFAEHIRMQDLALLQQQHIQPPARILDLACGTGTLALALAQAGYQMTGLDISPAMLQQAKHKQNAHPGTLPLQWQEADMRYFVTDTPFDAVLCHYDSLNHLSNESELRATFLQIAQALKPDGLLLFDLNTRDNYQTFWNGKDTYEGPNYRLKTTARFDETMDKAEVTFVADEYNEEGELSSHSETLYEQYFNETAVEKYLLSADFYDIQWETFNPTEELPADFPLKTLWRCRRRSA